MTDQVTPVLDSCGEYESKIEMKTERGLWAKKGIGKTAIEKKKGPELQKSSLVPGTDWKHCSEVSAQHSCRTKAFLGD